uniref:Uncharacterized protein n=1 Tax=Arundo donax TaxID=35708 RepID=A0A0A8ZYB0_ARUDO
MSIMHYDTAQVVNPRGAITAKLTQRLS